MKKLLSTGILITLLLSLLAACSPQSQSNSTSDFFATPAPIVVPEPVEQTNKSLKIYYSDYASMPMMDAAVQLYQKQYPDVKLEVEKTSSPDLEDYNTKYQKVANQIKDCIFSGENNTAIMYRVAERSGLFDMEYYVEQIDGSILEEKDGQIKVRAPAMSTMETLVCYRDKPLTSGETVYWLNPSE